MNVHTTVAVLTMQAIPAIIFDMPVQGILGCSMLTCLVFAYMIHRKSHDGKTI